MSSPFSRVRDQIAQSFHALQPDDTQPLPALDSDPPEASPELVELLAYLGVALLNSAEPVRSVARTLDEVAAAYDVDIHVMVLPTVVMIRVGHGRTDMVSAPNRSLRLDQMAMVARLVDDLRTASVTAAEGLVRLDGALRAKPRFSSLVTFLGLMVLSLGIGLLLGPDLRALPAYAALGACVGLLRLAAQRWPTLAIALPVAAAFLVTALSVTVLTPLVYEDPIRLITPALVIFLPGTALTIATLELATDEMVAGASRLVWAIAQLLLLTFGVLLGLSVSHQAPVPVPALTMGPWAAWLGVAVTAVGFVLYSCAPRGSLVYLLVTLLVAYAAQTIAALTLSPEVSGFFGGLVLVPLSELLARMPKAPPAAVLLLPGFWLLVPGAIGFRGVSDLAAGMGAQDVLTTVITMFAIALGVLVGSSLTRDARALRRGWHQAGR